MITFEPITHEGYKLFHEGAQALSQVEAAGIKVDMAYLSRAKKECSQKISQLKTDLLDDSIYARWRKRFGTDANLGSRDQLGKVLFEDFKHECKVKTPSGRPSTDDEALRGLGMPFVDKYLEMGRWQKALSTYLRGIEREITDGYLHPFFNLHTTATGRSSSDSPNFQNIPIRRPEIAQLIRSMFIPRGNDRCIMEFDFKGIEVGISACYNRDPVLIKYVSDETKDMHRDMAMQCYILNKKQMTPVEGDKDSAKRVKNVRYSAKNGFVFPEFYGNWYVAVARDMWRMISELKLGLADGTLMLKHLKKHGITKLGDIEDHMEALEVYRNASAPKGTFIRHIQDVEKDFWGNRFKVYSQWKRDWIDAYNKRGYFDTLTGFRCSAVMDRKQAVNFPVQGSAFHCLLWSLTRVQKLLRKYKMKSLIIGQIHDSMIMDVVMKEQKDVMGIVRQVTMVDLAKHWKWIIVPMRIECEAAPAGKSWYEKKEVQI